MGSLFSSNAPPPSPPRVPTHYVSAVQPPPTRRVDNTLTRGYLDRNEATIKNLQAHIQQERRPTAYPGTTANEVQNRRSDTHGAWSSDYFDRYYSNSTQASSSATPVRRPTTQVERAREPQSAVASSSRATVPPPRLSLYSDPDDWLDPLTEASLTVHNRNPWSAGPPERLPTLRNVASAPRNPLRTPDVNRISTAPLNPPTQIVESSTSVTKNPTVTSTSGSEVPPSERVEKLSSSTKVSFGAGASVIRIITGFKSARVAVTNLPLSATKNEVVEFFTQPGFDKKKFVVTSLNEVNSVRQKAVVLFDDVAEANLAIVGLDGMDFGYHILKLEMTSVEEVQGASNGDSNVLNISWPAPSDAWIAGYPTKRIAQDKVRQLNRQFCLGSRAKVEMNRMTGEPRIFNENSIRVSGLSLGVTAEIVEDFCGSYDVKSAQYDIQNAMDVVQTCIRGLGLVSFERQALAQDGMVTVKARFSSWKNAQKGYDRLEIHSMHFLGGEKCRLFLPEPLYSSKAITPLQFEAQATAFKLLAESSKTAGARVVLIPRRGRSFPRIEVSGSDKKAFGLLKVRVEQLMAGEKLKDWDRFFWAKEGETFLAFVSSETKSYVRRDGYIGLKAFGEARAVDQAKVMIQAKIKELESADFWVPLNRTSIKYFVDKALPILKELVGEDNVTLNLRSRRVTIRGGEDAKHLLYNLVDQSSASNATALLNKSKAKEVEACPICFDDIDNPYSLPCGHSYCTSCLRHFLNTASDTKQFPMTCMGNDATCGKPIPVPTLQHFLPPTHLERLLEASFSDFLDRHPNDYKHCTTPDCPHIHRLEQGIDVVRCPNCFASACTTCDHDHEGFTCAEWKVHHDPEEQERLLMNWADENANVKKCPSCRAFIEKSGGCNHMECGKCKTHICWVCMGVFDRANIYPHMTSVHGGYGI